MCFHQKWGKLPRDMTGGNMQIRLTAVLIKRLAEQFCFIKMPAARIHVDIIKNNERHIEFSVKLKRID